MIAVECSHVERASSEPDSGSRELPDSQQQGMAGGAGQAGGSPGFVHEPVMLAEVAALLSEVPAGIVVDATVGGGGHARAILESRPDVGVLGIDRDPSALSAARSRLAPFGTRALVVHGELADLEDIVGAATSKAGPLASYPGVSGVLFDLGVSSEQIDRAERGFSYSKAGPLDMRMDPTRGRTAASVVNELSEDELASLFAANGEGRNARRLARAVVAARPLTGTGQLAALIAGALGGAGARRGGHPAKRVFQAVRIEVNGELEQLQAGLEQAIGLLQPGGRLVCISYHSGEDRLVKAAMATAATGGCTCPPKLPCGCGAVPVGRLVFKGAKKSRPAEVEDNPRSKSARLRCLERLAIDQGTQARPGTQSRRS